MTDAEMEKIWNNLKRNLKSYCDENGFSDVMLGLSGGLDSAIVSVLACDALGAEHVHALMMKTDYTSELSLQIAAKIAALNGFDYKVVDIQPLLIIRNVFWPACSAKRRKILCWRICRQGRGEKP
ncbi:MAG: hypothetical protein ACLSE6_07935 [Alphaproteobacteria bacterium]